MKITVNRATSFGGATIGKLYIDGRFVCYTLEDEVREIQGKPVSEWKIKSATAIPSGTYKVRCEYSPRFGPDTLTLLDVPGFTHIRMHAGNSALDTDGCLLLGMKATPASIVGGTSRPAVSAVKSEVLHAQRIGEPVEITISNHTEIV